MMVSVQTADLPLPEVNRSEVLRYAGAKQETPEVTAALDSLLQETADTFCGRVCWGVFPVSRDGEWLDLGFARTDSRQLRAHLERCSTALVFAATTGLAVDRLILRWGKTQPSKALLLQALGAERIEALCDAFQQHMALPGSRFSPGYGDLPLDFQRSVFRALDCSRKIGLSLNDSLIMSPSKSVTAIIGMGADQSPCAAHDCSRCGKTDCLFRRSL